MEHVFEHKTAIDFRDVDGRGQCRPSALLGHLQQASAAASTAAGHGRRSLLRRYGAVWLLVRLRYELTRPLLCGERLTVTTWHREARAGGLYRDYDLFCGAKPVGRATSLWVLVEADGRKVLNLSRVAELAGSAAARPDRQEPLPRLRFSQAMEEVERRPMRYSDTDINGHVNNTRYADFACDAIHAELLPPEQFIAEMRLGYTAECRPGELITISVAGQGNLRFVRGEDAQGRERFCAQMRLDKRRSETVE